MSQDTGEPDRAPRLRERRAVRHTVEPVGQAAKGERRQCGEQAGHEGPEPTSQEEHRDRRHIDQGEEVGPEREPQGAAQKREEEGGSTRRCRGRADREEQREGAEHHREGIVASGLLGPKEQEVRGHRQQDGRQERGPRPERVARQPDGQGESGQREQHRQQRERTRRDAEGPEDGRGEVPVQRTHE